MQSFHDTYSSDLLCSKVVSEVVVFGSTGKHRAVGCTTLCEIFKPFEETDVIRCCLT